MICDEFLSRYSEFLDDRLPLPEAAAMRRHVRECDSCGRYDRVMTEGRRALRTLPDVEPSSAYYVGLRARLAEAEPASVSAARTGGPGGLATLSIAAVIAMIAWSALLRPEPPTIELPAMAAHPPAPEVSWGVSTSGPRFSPAAWRATWWSHSVGPDLRPVGAPSAAGSWSSVAYFAPPVLSSGGGSVFGDAARGVRTTFE